MGIGPFTTYAPPGVYTRTIAEPVIGQLLGGLRIPVLIGTGQETLTQTDFEIVRGSSSLADTPIFGEDVTGQWFVGGTAANPTLGKQDGNRVKFRVRNYPIVDGGGTGKVTYDVSKVSVSVDGSPAVVSALDGVHGIVTLLVPPSADSVVTINYYFHRKDTRVLDDVSAQVSAGPAVLVAPKAESYNVTAGASDTLVLIVNDTSSASIKLTPGTSRAATDIANDVNAANVAGLTASVHVDAQGQNHVQFVATGNVQVGSGNANGVLGLNPGDYTNRSKVFRVFNGPIVDGSDGGVTTTDPSKVVVLVNGAQVLAKAVDGKNQSVTLPAAPAAGSVVTIQYYFNTFQDTFDYLPNSNIVTVGNVGIAPGRRDYLNGPDFVIINQGDQSLIQWGTAFQVFAGAQTGTVALDSTQVTGMLVDNRIYGAPCTRYVDPTTATVSQTKFVLPLSPTTGNGRDTPLGTSLYQTISNGRIDLPTNRPDLVTVHVGKTWRDARVKPPVTVLSVDSATNAVVLASPVPADYQVFATFWYNVINDDAYTLSVVTSGPSEVGTYTITSAKDGALFGAKFGTKSGLSHTVQWPSGSESVPDAIFTGAGTPVPETVTVKFMDSLDPATNASFSSAGAEPYDIYASSRNFGGVVVDGNPAVTVDLSLPFAAQFLGQPVGTSLTFLSTDYLVVSVDGVLIAPVSLNGLTTMSQVVTALNAAIDSDTQVHADGSGTFASTSPNNLASVTTSGSSRVLLIRGRNVPSSTNGLVSSVSVLSPTAAGQTDGSSKLGLTPNQTAYGSSSAINQPAVLIGTQTAPFSITTGVNDQFQLSVDGLDVGAVLPGGAAVTLDDVVAAVNDAYVSVASAGDLATFTADVITLANSLRTAYSVHIASTTYHVAADSVDTLTLSTATDLATAIALLNQIESKFNAHLTQSGVHELNDAFNAVSLPAAVDLKSAVALAHALKDAFNLHLVQKGVHGHNDTVDSIASIPNATDLSSAITLVNAAKMDFDAHLSQSGVHLANDATNIVTTATAVDQTTAIALANAIKAAFNAHLSQSGVHVVNDTTNAVTAADATNLASLQTLANAIQTAFDAHLVQTQGVYHVHGTNDVANGVSANVSQLVARAGQGINFGKLVLASRTNTVSSQLLVKSTGSANSALGFVSGISASRTQPTAAKIAGALNANSSFASLAAAYSIQAPGLGRFLEIVSRTSGAFSTVAFSAVANSALIPDTGLGIVPGVSSAVGEPDQAGFQVSSSAGAAGSNGYGFPGQTYTDATTGLRFTVLPAAVGDYDDGGSFTLVVSPNFVADASIPVRAVPGLELTVFNTLNMNAGTTAVVNTYAPTGNHPAIGDVFYVSYNYAKSDLKTQLFRDLKTIQANFGTPTPDNPLSLGAQLALLNGAVLIGLKQVLRTPGGSQASVGSFTAAIDEQRKALPGNVKPDVIAPLGTDPNIFSYLSQHCIFMSSPRQEGERIAIVGPAAGTSPIGAQAIAQGLSSELMVLTYPDSYVISIQDNQGNLTDQLVDASFMAAALAGSTCNPSIDVATPLTRRQITGFKSTGRVLDPTEANQTAVKGVTIIESVESGLRVRHGLTTRIDTVITRTPSVTLTIQLVQQTMRRVLDPYIGQKFTGTLLKSVENAMTGAFAQLIDSQIVAKVAGITASVDDNDPTVMRSEAIYVPVFPLEYIVSTLQIRVRL